MKFPSDSKQRKEIPLFSGYRKYFPLAHAEVAKVSRRGGQQHAPGQPLEWKRDLSADQLDAADRHLTEYAMGLRYDEQGNNLLAQVVWRCLAQLQIDLEQEESTK